MPDGAGHTPPARPDAAFRRLAAAAGVDRAVGFSILSRGWAAASFPVTLYCVTTFFTREVQGYFYTFSSLIFLQAVLELGFGAVLVQFVSHEWARLRFNDRGEIEGDPVAVSRIASLFRMALAWYAALAVLFFIVLGAGGYIFLTQYRTAVGIAGPWWSLCATVSLSLLLLPLRGILEGSDRIDRSQQITLAAGIVSAAAGWWAIVVGAGLYALVVINAATLVATAAVLIPSFAPYFRAMRGAGRGDRISWREEFWPQQWRIGTSWLAGFFMFQSFVPFMYQFHGPEAAGKVGATLTVFNAVNAFSQTWSYAVGPRMGMLSARRDFRRLRELVGKTYKRSLAASVLISAGAIAAILVMRAYRIPQAERFADVTSLSIFLAALVAMQLTSVETQAVRFQKKEPFIGISVTSAILVILSNVVLGSRHGVPGMAAGFIAVIGFYLVPMCHKVYRTELACGCPSDGEVRQ